MAAEGPGDSLITIARDLRDEVARLRFGHPVAYVYNPLEYAWDVHRRYLERFGGGSGRAVLLGMNPGPFGMAQTGVPFGEVGMVRDWMGLQGIVTRPAREHPKRPVLGFDCHRSEVSGGRLWGWARRRFRTAERFFARFLVLNYCPLVFLEETGRNRTPDKLAAGEKRALFACCDRALRRAAAQLQPAAVVGVGRFAADRAAAALVGMQIPAGCILHPSPANPQANRGWEAIVERQLREMGIALAADEHRIDSSSRLA
ncbi:MAG TPA: uracil-DNA glycosylase family protein [Thermoanaerobaculia bacterium]|nr:uracil-DNA glycosylase family protein [Thermoanaerobaculia bacterium]